MPGAQCCENPPVFIPGAGVGSVVELGGLKAYVTGLSDSKHAILIFSDIFGYEAPNLRKLADKVAASGFYVVVPDFFHGDPYNAAETERPLPVWISDHPPAEAFEDAIQVIEALKIKGICVTGAAGICSGSKGVVDCAKEGIIQAACLLHPSSVTEDDIKEVKVPIAILGAEIDSTSPPELIKKFEEILVSKTEMTVRYKLDDEKAVKSANKAHQDTIDWFLKYLN